MSKMVDIFKLNAHLYSYVLHNVPKNNIFMGIKVCKLKIFIDIYVREHLYSIDSASSYCQISLIS